MLHGHANRDLWESVDDFLGHISVGRVPQSRCVCVCVCLNGGGCGGGAHTLKSLMYIGHVGEKERVDETIFRTTQHP